MEVNANEHLQVSIKTFKPESRRYSGYTTERNGIRGKMILKIFALAAILMVCEGTIPDRLYYRRAPLRFIFNNQGRRPNTWNYQVVNGRPIISGYPNSNSYVAFGLNPQTGQVEQTQIITQTRPGGPVVNMIQNMLHVAGQFFGQLTGAFGNAVGGALHTAGQFGQDIQDVTSPVISVTGVSQPGAQPIQQPSQPATEIKPTVETPTTPAVETVPEQAKSDLQTAVSTLDQAVIAFQTFRTNVQSNFQNYFDSEEGTSALIKVNENINWAVNKLQNLRETAIAEPVTVLQSGQTAANTAFDNIELALVGVTGTQGRDFIEPTRSEMNKVFSDAIAAYQELTGTGQGQTEAEAQSESEISPAK